MFIYNRLFQIFVNLIFKYKNQIKSPRSKPNGPKEPQGRLEEGGRRGKPRVAIADGDAGHGGPAAAEPADEHGSVRGKFPVWKQRSGDFWEQRGWDGRQEHDGRFVCLIFILNIHVVLFMLTINFLCALYS